MSGVPDSFVLRGGIIAAGQGTRLRADGYRVSKPMTPVDGWPLIGHALDRFRTVGVHEAAVIINEGSDDCLHWLDEHGRDFDLDLMVRTTPSSYASFEIVAARLAGAPALITTVDAIMPVSAFHNFVRSAARFPDDAVVLGLTDHVDDDNPLWASSERGRARPFAGRRSRQLRHGRALLASGISRREAENAFRPSSRLSHVVGRRGATRLRRRSASRV